MIRVKLLNFRKGTIAPPAHCAAPSAARSAARSAAHCAARSAAPPHAGGIRNVARKQVLARYRAPAQKLRAEQLLCEVSLELVEGDAFLLHGVALANGHGLVFE